MYTLHRYAWVLWFLACTLHSSCNGLDGDKRCMNIISGPSHEACELFLLVYNHIDGEAVGGLPCPKKDLKGDQCESAGCCVYKGKCYQKPVKCYADFRMERCPLRQGWKQSSIFTGFSINESYCFIDSIQSYLSYPDRFWRATSADGVRILTSEEHDKSCVKWMNTTVVVDDEARRNCTVRTEILDNKIDVQHGRVRANKCVLYSKPYYIPFDIGKHRACVCHLDAWTESRSENTDVSDAIRQYAESEEMKSSCSRILGRFYLKSWRGRVDVVNGAEAEIVVGALLNITNEKIATIEAKDVEVLLDSSQQLSKYKFYEGLENDSADLLIQSSTKFLSKIMKRVTLPSSAQATISKRSIRPQDSVAAPEDLTTYKSSIDLQWKIMENLEDITENIASLITLPKDEPKYVISAKEGAVSLQVSIASPDNVQHLANITKLYQEDIPTDITPTAHVTNFTSYKGDDNVAIITAFYNIPEEGLDESGGRRASGILAINPRTMKGEVVSGKLPLPVQFTLPGSRNRYCNGTACKPSCSFLNESESTYGERWEDFGCQVVESHENFTTCACNHTTHFAVLMLPTSEDVISEEDTRVLEMLSVIFGCLSIAAIAATLAVFIVYRRILLKDRMLIHLHMIIALMGGYISFLCGSIFSSRYLNIPIACFSFTIASHLFFLATFFWFLMEGVYLFYKVVLVFSNKWAEGGAKYSPFIGWGCPIAIVSASVLAARIWKDDRTLEEYYDPERCFLQTRNGMIWAFLAPVVAIIAVMSIDIFVIQLLVLGF